MKDWHADKNWSDKFLAEIKQILGLHLIGPPPQEEDMLRNTDLIVLRMEACRIACRIRRYQYIVEYNEQFTIRSGRPNGTKTELTKIIEGWGNYLFYGFADSQETHLAYWTLADLNVFRVGFFRSLAKHAGKIPGIERLNQDGSSSFHSFKWANFPGIIVASSADRDQIMDAYLRNRHRPVQRSLWPSEKRNT